ncbi:hypothetical protein EVA_20530 [gut metagenome]|uniref:Uncharacterized protein n=1 Tax=gut metagenome TaxID=749906 RepID=J9F8Y5_9ZZZZ
MRRSIRTVGGICCPLRLSDNKSSSSLIFKPLYNEPRRSTDQRLFFSGVYSFLATLIQPQLLHYRTFPQQQLKKKDEPHHSPMIIATKGKTEAC